MCTSVSLRAIYLRHNSPSAGQIFILRTNVHRRDKCSSADKCSSTRQVFTSRTYVHRQDKCSNVCVCMCVNSTVKVASQSRWCHSQGGVTARVVSQSRWCHRQDGVTVKVVSQSRWCHSLAVVVPTPSSDFSNPAIFQNPALPASEGTSN